jgi:hypothetical protein
MIGTEWLPKWLQIVVGIVAIGVFLYVFANVGRPDLI